MSRINFKKSQSRTFQGAETRFVVSARCTNASAFVQDTRKVNRGKASELGSFQDLNQADYDTQKS